MSRDRLIVYILELNVIKRMPDRISGTERHPLAENQETQLYSLNSAYRLLAQVLRPSSCRRSVPSSLTILQPVAKHKAVKAPAQSLSPYRYFVVAS